MATITLNFQWKKAELFPLWRYSNLKSGFILSEKFNSFREILVQGNKAVYGPTYQFSPSFTLQMIFFKFSSGLRPRPSVLHAGRVQHQQRRLRGFLPPWPRRHCPLPVLSRAQGRQRGQAVRQRNRGSWEQVRRGVRRGFIGSCPRDLHLRQRQMHLPALGLRRRRRLWRQQRRRPELLLGAHLQTPGVQMRERSLHFRGLEVWPRGWLRR